MGAHFTPPDLATETDIRAELDALLAMAGAARYMRRELQAAAERGAAMLDALDLPPLALNVLDATVAALDALDGDMDLEPYLAGYYNGAIDPDGEREGEEDPDEDDGISEHTLGAPERCPYVVSPSASYYRPGNGSYLRLRDWYSQASWAQGSRVEGEGEAEAGYDLPEGDNELDDDGLTNGEKDESEQEHELGSPIGDGNQEHWAQGFDGETVNEDGGDEYREPATRPISPRRLETQGYTMRDDARTMARRAHEVRARLYPAASCNPDEVTIYRDGVAFWTGPYVTRDGVPVIGCAT